MGNRAVVVFKDEEQKHGVYLHWNGGPESILAFIQTMEDRKWTRMDYASARFVGIVSEFFDSDGTDPGLSLAITDDPDSWKDGCDNGKYDISRNASGFVVKNKGKKLTTAELNADDLKQYRGIIDALAKCRAARVKVGAS